MERFCDLHVHSIFSDGSETPAYLIEKAEEMGLTAIALCDHNTIAGLPDFLSAAKGKQVQAVPGIEFSTDYQGTELHILGLFLPESGYGAITALLEQTLKKKEENNRLLVKNLNEAGYDLDYEQIVARTPKGHINRAHIAEELTRKGYTSSVKEAFRTLLSEKTGIYKRAPQPAALDVIRFIKSIGAIAVLAHPFLNLDEKQLREFLPLAVKAGLDAMETVYVDYDEKTTRTAKAVAADFSLKESGGSDFHGKAKPEIFLGIGRGDLRVPTSFLRKMMHQIDA